VLYIASIRSYFAYSYQDAVSIIREWLDRCDKSRPLVGVSSRTKAYLSAAARVGYLPKGFSDLKTENRQLADLISPDTRQTK